MGLSGEEALPALAQRYIGAGIVRGVGRLLELQRNPRLRGGQRGFPADRAGLGVGHRPPLGGHALAGAAPPAAQGAGRDFGEDQSLVRKHHGPQNLALVRKLVLLLLSR